MDAGRMAAAAGAVRDQVLALIDQHEREAHGGEACPGSRAAIVAFLAHALGVRGDAWECARVERERYDVECAGGRCEHREL